MSLYKNKYFNPAVFLVLFAVAVKFGPAGATWLWAGRPIVAAVLLATSVVFWILLFSSHRKPRS